ncbi:hypothetical protein BT63DRAFT_425182 [Microthyrium microscopicum]|uniref:Uncharacterized protein n=1 Tax=Microthyrium microscopicum TaxID=703497 RepID=A0A6A6UB33_9PEZI|nr:hypothetical protein BT63DRAFT_425182 [Microthyrium microscopicum]
MNIPRRGGGMQVHAVPESERATDPANPNQKLPWGYEYADADKNSRRAPEERGPFGRPTTRRGASRTTRTQTPARQDQDNVENWKAIDDIFSRAKKNTPSTRINQDQSSQNVTDIPAGVPTEVILYGFPEIYQFAAIEFYERVSAGVIYEDYERYPSNTKFDMTLSRNTTSRRGPIPPAALPKVNAYHGGEHWIKVTFNSTESADRACYRSPHQLHGHIIYAERYRGEGPNRDEAIPATADRIASLTASPSQSTSSTIQPGNSSNSSATATFSSSATAQGLTPGNQPTNPSPLGQSTSFQAPSTSTPATERPRAVLLRGASRAVLQPAELALLPTNSRWQQTFGSWPIIGFFLGGPSQDMIGSELPRKDDGSFDWDRASMYWKFWACLDYYMFFDFLGLKSD